jgi:uncharacterized protein
MLEIWLAFLAGLAGSPHCLGMCGGIVAAIALNPRDAGVGARRRILLAYNLGRILTYTILGAVAGVVGASLDLLSMKTFANWVFAAANTFVLLVGLASMLQLPSLSLFSLESAGGKFFSGILRWSVCRGGFGRTFLLGMALGLLPCGLVYAPLIAAAASGNPATGAGMMAALGLGTLPLLLFFGEASSLLSRALRGNLLRTVGLCVALIGFTGLWRLLGKMGYLMKFPLW